MAAVTVKRGIVMLDSQWYLGVWLAVMASQVVVLYGLYRRRRATDDNTTDTTDAADHEAVTVDDGVVQCPDCETANSADYRYCGGCAQQLPHAGPLDQQKSGPMGSLFG